MLSSWTTSLICHQWQPSISFNRSPGSDSFQSNQSDFITSAFMSKVSCLFILGSVFQDDWSPLVPWRSLEIWWRFLGMAGVNLLNLSSADVQLVLMIHWDYSVLAILCLYDYISWVKNEHICFSKCSQISKCTVYFSMWLHVHWNRRYIMPVLSNACLVHPKMAAAWL